MDGLEIAASTMCSADNCPVCECPKRDLDKTDVLYPLRNGASVKAKVEAARARLLEPDGSIKRGMVEEVCLNSYMISYMMYILNSMNLLYEFICDITYENIY